MARLYAVAGSKIFIGAAVNPKGLVTAADFVGATWTEIGGWAQAGAIGDTQEVITQQVISENRVRKMKGPADAGTMENTFLPDSTDPGQILFRTAINNCRPYQFKIEWGAACPLVQVVTVNTTANAVTWTDHGFLPGNPIKFSTTGALPATLTAGTTYYVVSTGLTASDFRVSATPGGTPIALATAGTGVHTAESGVAGLTDLFFGLALPGSRQGGAGNAAHLRSWSIAVDSNVIEV